jgi:uncharacterized OB-fold protein
VTFLLPVCASCGHAVFPSRVLCPACGGTGWETREAAGGVAEQVTAWNGVGVAAVRTDLGPVVVARALAGVDAGGAVELAADGGVPIARPA